MALSLAEVLGVLGFGLGILNYLRDRAVVKVTLKFDMVELPIPEGRPPRKLGVIWVTNTGRRPVFLSVVSLAMPYYGVGVRGFIGRLVHRCLPHLGLRVFPVNYGILPKSVEGQRIGEGDKPAMQHFTEITTKELAWHAKRWREIRAVAEFSDGRRAVSSRLKKKPTWAEQSPEETGR